MSTLPPVPNPLPQSAGGTGANTFSGGHDAAFGNTVGTILARLSTGWSVLPPGSNGQVLTIVNNLPAYVTQNNASQAYLLSLSM